jgi:hypothetical protein
MKKRFLLNLMLGLLFIAGLTSNTTLNAQLVDSTDVFYVIKAASTDTILHATMTLFDVDADGVYDAGFALSGIPITSWGNYSCYAAFYSTGLAIRNGGSMTNTNTILVEPGEPVELWFDVDLTDSTYFVWAKTVDMTFPELIFDSPAAFRNQIDSINRWSTLHNPAGEPDSLANISVEIATTIPGFNVSTLDSIILDLGTLSPAFDAATSAYTVDLPEGTTTVNVSAYSSFSGASVAGDGAIDVSTGSGTATIVVTSIDGSSITPYTVEFTVTTTPAQAPSEAAPTPNKAAANVISVFSDAYASIEGTDFNPWWSQSTIVTKEEIATGDTILKYASFNYQGTQFGSTINGSLMDTLHVDMWTSDATTVNVYCIGSGEKAYALAITPYTWVSYDIPLTAFSDVVDISGMIQFKFDGGDGTPTIYLDNLYFSREAALPDATLSDLQVGGTTIEGFNPLTPSYTYNVPIGTTVVPTITATPNDGAANAAVSIAPGIPGTTTITVTASDNVTEIIYEVEFVEVEATPETAAPTPTKAATDVISIFSDAYTNVSGTDFNPPWGQSTAVTTVEIETGDAVLKYATFNYQGTQFGSAVDASLMDTLHIDMWTPNATTVNVYCISSGPIETAYALAITPNTWTSYDIPLTAFSSVVDMSDVIQFKFAGGDGTPTIYLDNLYFSKQATAAGQDATLDTIWVDGKMLANFSQLKVSYNVELLYGTTLVPTVTASTTDENATASITPASDVNGTANIKVVSEDFSDTLIYRVEFSVALEGPTEAAPTPPVRTAEDVISIFSDAYTNIPGTNFNPNWGQSTVVSFDTISLNNSVLKYKKLNYQGTEFTSQDVSGMDYLHVDIWTGNATAISLFCISSGPVEKSYGLTIIQNEWVSYDIPVTDYSSVVDLTDVFQFKFTGVGPVDSTQIFIDNLYFFKGTPSKSNDATLKSIQMDGADIESFDAATVVYTFTLDAGTTTVPAITAESNHEEATVEIADADSVPGVTIITVTAEDGTTKKTYTLRFFVEDDGETAIDNTLSAGIKLYAHAGILHVNSTEELLNGKIEIYNLTGQMVASAPLLTSNEQVQLNIKGLYIVRITRSGNQYVLTQKILIK